MSRVYRTMCPCKDCPDRYRACHDTCPRYKAWKEDSVDTSFVLLSQGRWKSIEDRRRKDAIRREMR